MLEDKFIKIRKRHLPHWTTKDAVYFITFNLKNGYFDSNEKSIIFNHIKNGNEKFYDLFAMVVMHNHVHLIIKPFGDYQLDRILKGIKGVSSRLVNEKRGTKGSIWQDEYYDRIIRDAKEFDEKIRYIFENPIRQGLVARNDEYEFYFFNE